MCVCHAEVLFQATQLFDGRKVCRSAAAMDQGVWLGQVSVNLQTLQYCTAINTAIDNLQQTLSSLLQKAFS
jgi:hypothetical protein